jgi:acyl-homoserine lactone acylase PvdQ
VRAPVAALGLFISALLVLSASAGGASRNDYASIALDVLAPGENGGVAFNRNTNDQAQMYDGLTPLQDRVTKRDLSHYFKPEWLGTKGSGPTHVEDVARTGARVVRDRYGVAHITGKTRADAMYAVGWVSVEDRGLLMELLRSAGRLAALSAPGYDAFAVAISGRTFIPSAQTESFIAAQFKLVDQAGSEGKRVLADIDSFLEGINAYYRKHALAVPAWTRNDAVATASVIAARLGGGGGDELRRSLFLSALEQRLGKLPGERVFGDLAESSDPESPVAVPGTFQYQVVPVGKAPGAVVLDDGSFHPAPGSGAAPAAFRPAMSNALLVGAKRSANGHPLFVAGPQLGYYFPGVFLEADVHGGGIDTRGGIAPGLPYVVIGRGQDFAWSATSSGSDLTDTYVETLCGDDTHYVFEGTCRTMTTFDAGVLKGGGTRPDTQVVFQETVHGPVLGYATVDGTRVAVSMRRSTRGREILSVIPFEQLNENKARSPQDFFRVMGGMEFAFNWLYADSRHIGMFSSGRLPIRTTAVDPRLPAAGTGEYEWRGFLTRRAHAQGVDPPSGLILNWNQRPARGFGAADDNWSYGSVQRVDLLTANVAGKRKLTLAGLVGAMNKAATQDLRALRLLPVIEEVLTSGPAPGSARPELVQLLEAWRKAGASRLDRTLDGKVDDPGAAIMDAVWPRWAEAVMGPILGPLTDRLAELLPRDDAASSQGSSFLYGWYGYVDKDLRSLLGKPVRGSFSTRYCGAGDLTACRNALWAALDAAAKELEAKQGADPSLWRAEATAERIVFSPGILTDTMRWANRPTFQQVITFDSHR